MRVLNRRAAIPTPILAGGHTYGLAKYHPKITLIAKADLLTKLSYGEVGGCQQPLGFGNPQVGDIGDKRLTCHLCEEADKM